MSALFGIWSCPLGQCEHNGLVHDWEEDGVLPMCCTDGCTCGHLAAARPADLDDAAGARAPVCTHDEDPITFLEPKSLRDEDER